MEFMISSFMMEHLEKEPSKENGMLPIKSRWNYKERSYSKNKKMLKKEFLKEVSQEWKNKDNNSPLSA